VKAKEQETALRLSTAAAVATAQKGEALRELDRARRNLAKNESIRRKQAKLINDMSVSLKRAQQSNRNTLLETSVNETFIGDNVDSSINFDIRRSRASTSFALSSNPNARNLTQNVAPHVPQNVAPHGRKQRFAMITAEDITEDKMREALAVSFC